MIAELLVFSFADYIWQARYYGSGTPSPSDTGSWVPSESPMPSLSTLPF